MKSRGYGIRKRTSYSIYRFSLRDAVFVRFSDGRYFDFGIMERFRYECYFLSGVPMAGTEYQKYIDLLFMRRSGRHPLDI